MSKQLKNQVKIIAGTHRGSNILFPSIEGLRPTPARVRETLFNWLGQDLTGCCVLDLFAGSGVLGMEASSRGAQEVVMVEKSQIGYKSLQDNQNRLRLPNLIIHKISAENYLQAQTQKKFDVVFLDPPFGFDAWGHLLSLLIPSLTNNALVYIEAASAPEVTAQAFALIKSGSAGHSRQYLYQFSE